MFKEREKTYGTALKKTSVPVLEKNLPVLVFTILMMALAYGVVVLSSHPV